MTIDHDTHLASQDEADAQAVEAFALRMLDVITGGLLTPLVEIGRRTGLFDALATGPGTSTEIADRADLQERYVREWLGAMASAGIVEYVAEGTRFWLPAEHAAVLTGDTVDNVTVAAALVTAITPHVDAVTRCFTDGGGVPYSSYLPGIRDVMDLLWEPMCRDLLVSQVLPLAPALTERLTEGTRALDVGCGSGNALVTLGAAFPRSSFVGVDSDAGAIEIATRRATRAGLTNVSFRAADAAHVATDEPFGVAFVFNALHDQAEPAEVLAVVYRALEPGGILLLDEPRVSSALEDNLENPFAPMTYAISLLHCMTVSLAEGGAGLGTAWGEQVAVRMLEAAGFAPVIVHDAPGDPSNAVFVTRRPG